MQCGVVNIGSSPPYFTCGTLLLALARMLFWQMATGYRFLSRIHIFRIEPAALLPLLSILIQSWTPPMCFREMRKVHVQEVHYRRCVVEKMGARVWKGRLASRWWKYWWDGNFVRDAQKQQRHHQVASLRNSQGCFLSSRTQILSSGASAKARNLEIALTLRLSQISTQHPWARFKSLRFET